LAHERSENEISVLLDSSESTACKISSCKLSFPRETLNYTYFKLSNFQDFCVDECDYSTSGKQLFNALRKLIPVVDGAVTDDFDDSIPWS